MEAKKSALRSRKPLSDCSNKVVAATFSSSFIKSKKSSVSYGVKLLARAAVMELHERISEARYVPCPNELPLAASSAPMLLKQPSDNVPRVPYFSLHDKKRNACKNVLPQDFIERQRAYFAEIDAFELPEEEVESVLELD